MRKGIEVVLSALKWKHEGNTTGAQFDWASGTNFVGAVLRKALHVPISGETMSTFFYFEPFELDCPFHFQATVCLLNTSTITSRYSDARGFLCTTPVDSLSILSLLQGPFDSPLVSEGTAIQNDINVFIFQ